MSLHLGINGRTFSVDDPGGAVQVGLNLTEEFNADDSVDVTVYGCRDLSQSFDLNIKSTGYPIRSQLYGLVWEKLVLPKVLDSEVDVLFSPNGNGPIHKIDVPSIVYIHDVNAILGHSSDLYKYYRSAIIPRAAHAADAIITVSEFSKREISNVLDIPPSKIYVVYNGLKQTYLTDGTGESIDLPDKYVLYVGQMNPRKNVENLVKAFQHFRENSDEDYKLVLVGPGNKKIFSNLSIEQSEEITRPGYLSDRQLKYAYENASAFLFPSLHEGFGLPPLEAMACRTPVIASREGALPEVLDEYPTYVDPHSVKDISNGLAAVLSNNQPTSGELKRAEQHAKSFTWSTAKAELLEIFDEVS